MTAFLIVAALKDPKRLRSGEHHVGAEAEAYDDYWPTDEARTYDDPAAASFFLAGADETAVAVAAAASQQDPANTNRWIGHDDDEYEDATYNFPGKVKPTWESVDGDIRLNGRPFHVKGISWFGCETDTR